MRYLLTTCLLPVLCFVTTLVAADPPTPGGPDRAAQEVDALIRQLGDQNFDVRQAATQRLLGRPDAAPALRKALKSDDPEVARRAEAILKGLVRREEKQLAHLANNGEVDRAIELLVRRPQWEDEDAAWQVMTGLTQRLIDLSAKEFDQPAIPQPHNLLPAGDFRRYMKFVSPELPPPRAQVTGRVPSDDFRKWERVLVRAEEIEAGRCSGDLLVSAGIVRGGTDEFCLRRCVVFAGGPVKMNGYARQSVIVCDGDVTADNASDCLIIARGDVRVGPATACRIVALGKVHMPKSEQQNNQVKENEPNPLGFVKWFDPASVGVVVEAAEGGVRVKEAEENKRFAKAGLQAGDLVTALGGAKTDSPDAFRRLLRARLAEGDEMLFKVNRGEKSLEVKVPVKD